MSDTYISVREAAHRLGVSTQTVRRLVSAGVLPGQKLHSGTNSHLRIPERAVSDYMAPTRYEFWRHVRSGAVWAVRRKGFTVTGICGPLPQNDIRLALLPDYRYDEDQQTVDWFDADEDRDPQEFILHEPRATTPCGRVKMKHIIVTRHPAAEAFIRTAAPEFADASCIVSATADDVRGAVVAGNLPLHLAVLAAEVVAVEFDGAPPRGQEYTLADMETAGAHLARYRVTYPAE